jgi:hypothetical protein
MSAIGRREQERRYSVARENRRPTISAERNRLPVVAVLNIVNRCRMLAVFMEAIKFVGGSGKISAGRRLLLVATLLRHSDIGFRLVGAPGGDLTLLTLLGIGLLRGPI